ncbi:MAG: hypothetical protein IKU61_05770 [Clostridia bacterium]|nr:hypothetical protein [Clostridia bacterium]
MGGGAGGNFGNTFGKMLDVTSNLLTAASLIPGVDTIADVIAIPIDLMRGDFASAGLDLIGAIPLVGEIADTVKTAKVADNIVDAAKAVDKASDVAKAADKASDIGKAVKNSTSFAEFSKKIHAGKQGKHILGHNNYQKGKSILNISNETAQKLVDKYSGTGRRIGSNKEIVDFKRIIGKYVDPKTGKTYDTTVGTIHYSKTGTHIVPGQPKYFGG